MDNVYMFANSDAEKLRSERQRNTQRRRFTVVSSQTREVPKVLIVDDSSVLSDALKQQLEAAGYHVIFHSKSPGIMVKILCEQPDIILIDTDTTDVQGRVVCSMIKNFSTVAHTPILLLSAQSEEDLNRMVSDYWAHGYIHKYWDHASIIKKVSEFIR